MPLKYILQYIVLNEGWNLYKYIFFYWALLFTRIFLHIFKIYFGQKTCFFNTEFYYHVSNSYANTIVACPKPLALSVIETKEHLEHNIIHTRARARSSPGSCSIMSYLQNCRFLRWDCPGRARRTRSRARRRSPTASRPRLRRRSGQTGSRSTISRRCPPALWTPSCLTDWRAAPEPRMMLRMRMLSTKAASSWWSQMILVLILLLLRSHCLISACSWVFLIWTCRTGPASASCAENNACPLAEWRHVTTLAPIVFSFTRNRL